MQCKIDVYQEWKNLEVRLEKIERKEYTILIKTVDQSLSIGNLLCGIRDITKVKHFLSTFIPIKGNNPYPEEPKYQFPVKSLVW